MKLPYNGKELLDARKKGLKPRGVVLVTDTKKKNADCQLVIMPGMDEYDFSMLRGLDVFVAFESDFLRWEISTYRRWEAAIIKDIQRECRELYVIPSEIYWGETWN